LIFLTFIIRLTLWLNKSSYSRERIPLNDCYVNIQNGFLWCRIRVNIRHVFKGKCMAGHSKWNNIKKRKGAQDKSRAKVFSNISKLIKISVKEGGSGDPKFNPGLRVMLDKARAANMPKGNIDRAIERGLGKSANGATIQEIIYEGFGPGGVAILASSMTDNPNRTAAEVKFAFNKGGGSLGGPGSAMYMFKRDNEGGYVCTMPLDVDENTSGSLLTLVDSLRELEDVEDVYFATNIDENEEE
jgi:transcriptional/translational regulatory protein YebC/TACO1